MDSKTKENKIPSGSPKRKKRCRVRNRPRNKRNRQLVANQNSLLLNGKQLNPIIKTSVTMQSAATAICENANGAKDKTREKIVSDHEANKLAKKSKDTTESTPTKENSNNLATTPQNSKQSAATDSRNLVKNYVAGEKSRDQIKAEREAKKQAKQAVKVNKADKNDENLNEFIQKIQNFHIAGDNTTAATVISANTESEIKKKPVLTKAERRAIQEAQRAIKAQAQKKTQNVKPSPAALTMQPQPITAGSLIETKKATSPTKSSSPITTKVKECKVKLFNHLESSQKDVSLFVNNTQIHPSVARLGEQYAKRTVVGSNARCIAFMNALKMVIQDFATPQKKEFARSLETVVKLSVEHLQKCRPLAVSVSNAYKHVKHVLTQLPTDKPESELKEILCHFVDTYIENQIGKAAQAISSSIQEKINDGDVILTFGCSSLINYIFEEAHSRKVVFRVIIVDSRPFCEGQELLRRLTTKEIPCTYVLINAVGFVMPEVTKVLLGAHALLSNGYVMARTGTAQVALVANSFNVPVLVCCETHKFSERFQTDAIVYNELGDPHDLVLSAKCSLTNWQAKSKMSPLNLIYDITPPELVTAVVTEVSVLPCTSVPVILRIKPTEIGYYS